LNLRIVEALQKVFGGALVLAHPSEGDTHVLDVGRDRERVTGRLEMALCRERVDQGFRELALQRP